MKTKRVMHPNSLANLRPVKPGQVLNPKGSLKKADCLLDCIKEELSKISLNGIDTNEQIIAGVLVAKAARGDTRAVELMMSYLHARPTAGLELSNKAGEPFSLQVEVIDQETKKALTDLE